MYISFVKQRIGGIDLKYRIRHLSKNKQIALNFKLEYKTNQIPYKQAESHLSIGLFSAQTFAIYTRLTLNITNQYYFYPQI